MTNSSVSAPVSSLRILCFGDSLTAGYSQYGMLHFPYADHLKENMQTAFPSMKIHIDVEGMSGAQVRGQYLGRLSRACMKAEDQLYDWIIVMGGTNDLGWGGQPEEIYEALRRAILSMSHFQPPAFSADRLGRIRALLSVTAEKVWDLALDSGANVLALNVVECAASTGTIVQRRDRLNQLINLHRQDRWYVRMCLY